MRIGFLLNHYGLHQVPHVVPYAFELSRRHGAAEVTIFCSTQAEEDFAVAIGKGYPGHRCAFRRLHIPLWVKLAEPLASPFVFLRKNAALKANAGSFAGLDALVVPEMTSLVLSRMAGLEKLKLIFTGHGAGDNRLGGSFNARIGQFDLALLPGRKYAEGLQEAGHLPKDRYAIAGYPKLEAMTKLGIGRPRLFANDRPVVIYNPHHDRGLTSWHRFGAGVLDFFHDSPDYNLIFAPHVVLFQRAWSKGARLPARYRSTANMLIDTGSIGSADMTYLRAADIYLGDVSSQIYEFLEEPRPCVFLDAHHTDWRSDPSYRQWHFGPLIDDVSKLPEALRLALRDRPKYRDVQIAAYRHTFEIGKQEAGERGADIIAQFVAHGTIDRQWL